MIVHEYSQLKVIYNSKKRFLNLHSFTFKLFKTKLNQQEFHFFLVEESLRIFSSREIVNDMYALTSTD